MSLARRLVTTEGPGFLVVGLVRGKVRDISYIMQTWDGASRYARAALDAGVPIAWVAFARDPSRAEVLTGEVEIMAEKRVYVVEVSDGEKLVKKLVKAAQPAQAIRHVAKGMISAHVGKQDELIALAGSGVKVEEAGEDA